MASIVRGGVYVKGVEVEVVYSIELVETDKMTVDATAAGDTQESSEDVTYVAGVTTVPNLHERLRESTKLEPYTETAVLPDTGPDCGYTVDAVITL